MKGQKLERKIYGSGFRSGFKIVLNSFFIVMRLEVNQIGKTSKVGQHVVVDRTEVKVRLFYPSLL